MILKTELTNGNHTSTMGWIRGSHDVNQWHYYQSSSKGSEESALKRTALSGTTSRLPIILSLESFLSLVEMKNSSKDGE